MYEIPGTAGIRLLVRIKEYWLELLWARREEENVETSIIVMFHHRNLNYPYHREIKVPDNFGHQFGCDQKKILSIMNCIPSFRNTCGGSQHHQSQLIWLRNSRRPQ
jgi:3-deoxy-D-arabino-heptulosonate 7-phosphate (DAHP) synthase